MPKKIDAALNERALRMFADHRQDYPSDTAQGVRVSDAMLSDALIDVPVLLRQHHQGTQPGERGIRQAVAGIWATGMECGDFLGICSPSVTIR